MVGAGRPQRRAIDRARELGLRVLAVDRNPDAPGLAAADEGEGVDFTDVGARPPGGRPPGRAAWAPAPSPPTGTPTPPGWRPPTRARSSTSPTWRPSPKSAAAE